MNIVVTDPETGEKLRFKNFISSKVKAKMGQMTREFEFVAATRGSKDIPFFAGQAVEIFDGEDKLFTGFIEKMSFRSGGKGHQYTISGRDKMADLIDSNLPRMYDLTQPFPKICQYVIDFLGIDAIVIDENQNTTVLGYVASPDMGDTAGEFLADTARRKRALLQTDGDGNLVITAGIGTDVETRLVNRLDGVGNNMLEADFVIDHSQRFGRVSSEHQMNLAASDSATGEATPARRLVDREFTVIDPQIRPSRFRVVANDMNTIVSDALQRPLWEIGLNRAESIKYNVTVPGFRDWKDRLWELNTAPTVEDQFNGIDARMLIAEIEYSLDGEGPLTKMVLTDRDAFKAELKIRKDFVHDGPPEE